MSGWAYDPALREQLFGRSLVPQRSPCETCSTRRQAEADRERARVLAGLPASEGGLGATEGELAAGELAELRAELTRARGEVTALRARIAELEAAELCLARALAPEGADLPAAPQGTVEMVARQIEQMRHTEAAEGASLRGLASLAAREAER